MKSILISLLVPFRLSKNGLELWMQTRQEDGLLNGLLEFPGGWASPSPQTLPPEFHEGLRPSNFPLEPGPGQAWGWGPGLGQSPGKI